MDLYLMRHAEMVGTQPNDDERLTERGHQQAKRAAHWLKKCGVKPDLLVVSPSAHQSTKVRKAEEYSIPRVDETAFWHAIGVRIDP